MLNKQLRRADARNRSLRSFLQGLGFAVLAAVAMVVVPVFKDAHSWGDIDWSYISFAVVGAAVTAGLAYVMRTVLDPSRVPTPLPPNDPGPPAEGGQVDLSLALLIAILIGVVLLLFRVHFGGN